MILDFLADTVYAVQTVGKHLVPVANSDAATVWAVCGYFETERAEAFFLRILDRKKKICYNK